MEAETPALSKRRCTTLAIALCLLATVPAGAQQAPGLGAEPSNPLTDALKRPTESAAPAPSSTPGAHARERMAQVKRRMGQIQERTPHSRALDRWKQQWHAKWQAKWLEEQQEKARKARALAKKQETEKKLALAKKQEAEKRKALAAKPPAHPVTVAGAHQPKHTDLAPKSSAPVAATVGMARKPADPKAPAQTAPEAKEPAVPKATASAPAQTPAPTTASSAQPEKTPVAGTVQEAPKKSEAAPPASQALPTPAESPVLKDAKPDLAASAAPAPAVNRPQESPLSAIGDGGRMIFTLAPVLLLLVGALRLLKRYQERTGRLPASVETASRRLKQPGGGLTRARTGGVMNSLLGGFHLTKAREHAGSSIRILESVPLGGANIHLIEVRGRLLLLGATSGGIGLLTEIQEEEPVRSNDFRSLLQAAANNMEGLEVASSDLSPSLLVGTLDEEMRDARSAVVRNTRRLRTVQETEEEWVM